MKKSTGNVLLLSAFAAMILAGCGETSSTASGSSATPSATTSVTGSQDTTSGTSAAPSTSTAASSTTSTAASSSAAGTSKPAASSSTAASSSQAASSSEEEKDWSKKTFIGQYLGGFGSVIINANMTTSWGTETAQHPAELTVMANGVFCIKSTSAVDAEDRVEIYTDGTMAFVIHDYVEKDMYVMDKRASSGSAANSFAKTTDGSVTFGGLEVSNGTWKYFIVDNGAYSFNVAVTLQYGSAIDVYGAIFDLTYGGTTHTYRCTVAASGEGAYGTIAAYSLTTERYTGPEGVVVLGYSDGELVFVTKDGIDMEGAVLNGNTLTLKSSDYTVDTTTNPGDPKKVYATTEITLAKISKTYTVTHGTVSESLFAEITGATGTYSEEVGADGCIWVRWTAPSTGKLNITETDQVDTMDYDYYGDEEWDNFIWVFEAEDDTDYTSYSDAYRTAYSGYYAPYKVSITGLEVVAGKTYVIKAGAYEDRGNNVGATGSTHTGEREGFTWTFTAYSSTTYTGTSGDLVIYKDGTTVKGISLAGQTLKGTLSGTTLTIVDTACSLTDPTDPVLTTTTRTFTLDDTAHSYTDATNSVDTHPFNVLTAASTGLSGQTGQDGNLWGIFTPSSAGVISVAETSTSLSDSYLSIYKFATGSLSDLKTTSTATCLGKVDFNPVKLENIAVEAGVTYVIKHGAYACRDMVPGDTAASTTNIGVATAFSFTYTAYDVASYSGADGQLLICTKAGAYETSSLGGVTLEGQGIVETGTFTVKGEATYDTTTDPANPKANSTDTVFTLDETAHTYTKVVTNNSVNVIHELSETDTHYEGTIGKDGSLWCRFTPSTNGVITIDETTQASSGTSHDTLLAVYALTGTSTWADCHDYTSNTSGLKADNYVFQSSGCDNSNNPVYVHGMNVTANTTYIIKIGAYGGNGQVIGGSMATTYAGYVGSKEAFDFEFSQIVTGTFTGAEGALALETYGNNVKTATLGGSAMTGKLAYDSATSTLTQTLDPTYDLTTDPENPVSTSVVNTYVLDTTANTYVMTPSSSSSELIHTLTESDTGYSGFVGEDGSLWCRFTPTQDGVITIDETTQASNGSYNDTLLAVYALTGTNTWKNCNSYTASASYAHQSAGADNGNNPVYVHDMPVTAGTTYIIKIGAYSGNALVIGGKLSSYAAAYAGSAEAFTFSFTAYAHETFTGDAGTLDIVSLGTNFSHITLDGTKVNGTVTYDPENLTIKVEGSPVNDFISEPNNPKKTVTTHTFTLDATNHTYTKTTKSEESSYIHVLSETDTSYSGIIGADGSIWCSFTPTQDGTISILETTQALNGTYHDTLLAVYELGALNTWADCKSYSSSYSGIVAKNYTFQAAGADNGINPVYVNNMPVTAGKTYIIKIGAYSGNAYVLGETSSSAAGYVGSTEAFNFTFTAATPAA